MLDYTIIRSKQYNAKHHTVELVLKEHSQFEEVTGYTVATYSQDKKTLKTISRIQHNCTTKEHADTFYDLLSAELAKQFKEVKEDDSDLLQK